MAAQQFDIFSIGDSTIDAFMQIETRDTETICKLQEEDCFVCFAYGDKIPVSAYQRIAAVGNAANNAIGSARLGLKTGMYTVIGSDNDSQETKVTLENEGVDTEYVVMESGKRSNFSVVINYSGERTIFVYHEQHAYHLPEGLLAKWAYLTSVGPDHSGLHSQVVSFIKNTQTKLAFNPGTHQLRDGIALLSDLLSVTEVLSVNREEAVELLGKEGEIGELIMGLKQKGIGCVLITDGPQGSYASYDGREIWHVGIPQTAPIVERTGAGDAYTTAFLAALSLGKPLPDAMVWGTLNATSVVAHIGAREGLLAPLQMQEFIKQYGKEIIPKMM